MADKALSDLTAATSLAATDLLYAAASGNSRKIAVSDFLTGIPAGYIANASLADMAQATIKGRAAAAGTGVPVDLSAAQVKTLLAIDHGADLTGLSDDDHTQYALLAGRSGGQTLIGGTGSGDDLFLSSTSDSTKGTIRLGSSTTGLFFDEVNSRLSLGNSGTNTVTINGTSYGQALSVQDNSDIEVCAYRHSATAGSGTSFFGFRSRGTLGAETIVQADDTVLSLTGAGYDGTDYAHAAQIVFEIDATPGNNDMPGRILFKTTADGAVTSTEAMRINSDQSVQFASLARPDASDGAALGNATYPWSDLFLASGAVINFAASDVTVTHSTGLLTAAARITVPSTGYFYQSDGARVNRISDRLFVGDAVDNDGNAYGAPGSGWLEQMRNYSQSLATFVSMSAVGCAAGTFGSRTSDLNLPGAQACIGVGGYVNNDNSSAVQSAYAGYFEARRQASAGITHGIEIDIVNLGSTISFAPYSSAVDGMTLGLWVASGAGVGGAATAGNAITVVNNGADFEKGLIFADGSLAIRADYKYEAIGMPMGYAISFWDNSPNIRANIYSDTALSADSANLKFSDGLALFETVAGSTILSISTAGTLTLPATNGGIEMGAVGSANTPFIDFHSGATGVDYDARIIAGGGDGSIGGGLLNFQAATTQVSGTLRIEQTPTAVGTGAKTISNAADSSTNLGHYLVINLAGTNYYVPCGAVELT